MHSFDYTQYSRVDKQNLEMLFWFQLKFYKAQSATEICLLIIIIFLITIKAWSMPK